MEGIHHYPRHMRRHWAVVAITFAGCASGNVPQGQGDAAPGVDASRPDASEQLVDAPMTIVDAPPDARPIDAPPDAPPPPPDACVPTANEKLANPSFDSTPPGTGWQSTQVEPGPAYALVTDQDGVPEQSAPYKAWLGGVSGDTFDPVRTSLTDVLVQTVTLPADTSAVVLTGFYDVRSAESTTDTNVYDTAQLLLTDGNDVPIATVLTLSNRTVRTAWTAINHVFTQNLAGMTVKLKMTSTNDEINPTSFYFDTLSLKATHCP